MSHDGFWNGIGGSELLQHLNDDNFSEYLKQNAKAPVMYYAPWCGHSQEARHGYAGAAKQLEGKITLAALDCDEAPKSSRNPKHPIRSYPTFFFFENGKFVDEYTEERTFDGFVKWLTPYA